MSNWGGHNNCQFSASCQNQQITLPKLCTSENKTQNFHARIAYANILKKKHFIYCITSAALPEWTAQSPVRLLKKKKKVGKFQNYKNNSKNDELENLCAFFLPIYAVIDKQAWNKCLQTTCTKPWLRARSAAPMLISGTYLSIWPGYLQNRGSILQPYNLEVYLKS